MERKTARAKVRILLEISVDSVWRSDCQISQVYNQASDSVKEELKRLFPESRNVKIIGEPEIEAIITTNKV